MEGDGKGTISIIQRDYSLRVSSTQFQILAVLINISTGVLLVSIILDWSFYEKLTFPPFKFLYFNIAKSLAVFYGRNDWHYYPSQGYPMLLTTCLPFAAVGTYQALTNASNIGDTMKSEQRLASAMRYQLACISLAVPFILSFIAHKEVRFIYPVLPLLHVLSSPSIVACITPANAAVSSTKRTIPAAASSASSGIREPLRSSQKQYLSRKKFSICQLILLFSVLLLNLLIALFTTQYHQRGVLSVMAFLRHEYERDYLYQSISQPQLSHTNMTMTVGFLMPCHSTPWRSHLVYPNIHAWALGCEPPVHIPRGLLRDEYMDEADRFYADPLKFMQSEVGPYMAERRHNDITTDSTTSHSPATSSESQESQSSQVRIQNLTPWNGGLDLKLWPEYLVFFEASEEAISTFAKPIGFVACWRSWNSWFHDDWRRRGDLFVLRRPRCVARDDVETADGIVAQRKDTWIW